MLRRIFRSLGFLAGVLALLVPVAVALSASGGPSLGIPARCQREMVNEPRIGPSSSTAAT